MTVGNLNYKKTFTKRVIQFKRLFKITIDIYKELLLPLCTKLSKIVEKHVVSFSPSNKIH